MNFGGTLCKPLESASLRRRSLTHILVVRILNASMSVSLKGALKLCLMSGCSWCFSVLLSLLCLLYIFCDDTLLDSPLSAFSVLTQYELLCFFLLLSVLYFPMKSPLFQIVPILVGKAFGWLLLILVCHIWTSGFWTKKNIYKPKWFLRSHPVLVWVLCEADDKKELGVQEI